MQIFTYESVKGQNGKGDSPINMDNFFFLTTKTEGIHYCYGSARCANHLQLLCDRW